MSNMFANAGYSSSLFKLDCSKWNVQKVSTYSDFNSGVESKIIIPVWQK